MKIASPPAGSTIDLIEASDSRVVMVIPPGAKRARGMGCFALAWLAITVPVGVTLLLSTANPDVKWEGDGRPPLWGVALFFTVFWSVGLGMWYVALKMKFESLMLCLEPDRLSIQRSFLGQKMSTIQLREDSKARLQVSYEENDVPVYRIEIDGVSKKEKFGTALSRVEKQWLAQTINRFLGHEESCDSQAGADRFCRECGTQLLISEEKRVCPDCGAVYYDDDDDESDGLPFGEAKSLPTPDDVAPEDLPAGCGLEVEEDSVEQLTVGFLLNPSTALRVILGGMFLSFSLAWFGVACFMAWSVIKDAAEGSEIFVVFILFMACFGIAPLLIGLAITFGRARVTTSREWLSVRYHVGPIGFGRKVTTDSVQDIVLAEGAEVTSGSNLVPRKLPSVRVETTGKPLILTLGSKESISHNLCGVIRYQLHRLGFRLVSD
jgi:hypothetical protein